MIGLRDALVHARQVRAIFELRGDLHRPLVHGQRLLGLSQVAQPECEVDQPAEVESRVVHDALVAGLHDLTIEANRVLICVRPHVASGQNGFDANLLLVVAEKVGHPLRSLDDRERLLGLAGHVVRATEVAETNELIARREPVFELFENDDRIRAAALLHEAARFDERVLRGRWGRLSAKQVRGLYAERRGDVLERLHRCPRPTRFEHRDVCLRVVRLGQLGLGQAFGCPERTYARAHVSDHWGTHRSHSGGTLRRLQATVKFTFTYQSRTETGACRSGSAGPVARSSRSADRAARGVRLAEAATAAVGVARVGRVACDWR